MTRTFIHSFDPASASPVSGPNVDLEVSEIEDAGTPFIFREPLGQAREVKVALSGLFGRFVARAYLDRYLDLSIFAHLASRSLLLDGRRRIDIVRRSRGDLPDWVACAADLNSLTVAEAKGCHDPGGPDKALAQGMGAGPAHRRDGQRTEGDDPARRDRHALGRRAKWAGAGLPVGP